MKRFLTIALLCATNCAFGQSYYQNNAYTTTYLNGTRVVSVLQGAQIQVCSNISGACVQQPVFSDAGLTEPIAQPMTTDGFGNFGFWINGGTYSYRILNAQGAQIQAYTFTVGGGGGGSIANLITVLPRVDARAAQFAGGADPTGTNDSTAAFQAAINFAIAQDGYGVGGNPSVYCAPGNYKINGTLTLPGYLNFIGDGRGTCDLIETNPTANLITVGTAALGATATGSIRNVTLEGSDSATTGTLLEVDNTPGYTINGVQLYNTGGRGLQLNGHSERFSSHNLHIDYVRWPIVIPGDENEVYFVNTQIMYPGQTGKGYCYSINCVNGVYPAANQGAGGTATPISPDTHAAIYVDGSENFRFLGGTVKPLGNMAGFQNFNSSLGTLSNFYFEGEYTRAGASDSPSVEVGGAAPRTTLSSPITGTALVAPVTSTDWQPFFYESTANMPTSGDEDGTVYILMPADYLAGSTAASADVAGVQRGQYEKVYIEGFAGDGALHIYQRNIGGSTAPAGTAWPAGSVVEEAPHTYGGFAALTIASDHFGSQEAAFAGYTKNCNQLNTLTCGEMVIGFEPDGYWIDPTGGPNSNLYANVILHGDEMFNPLTDPYDGQIATHDNTSIMLTGYANNQNSAPESSEVIGSPYRYSISSTLGGSYITAPAYANGRIAETQVTDSSKGSTWWAAAGVYGGDVVSQQGPAPGYGSYTLGKQYADQYCFFDTPSSGTQAANRFCLTGGPNSANAGYEYDTWNGSAWVTGTNNHQLLLSSLGINVGNAGPNASALFLYSLGLATSTLNQGAVPLVFQSEQWLHGVSTPCHVHAGVDGNDVVGFGLQGGDDPGCKAPILDLPINSQILTSGGTANVEGVLGTPVTGHIAVFSTNGYVADGGAVPAGSTIAATSPITATTSGGTTTIACPTCTSSGIANIQITTAPETLAANTCDATSTTVTMTGLATTSTVSFTYATDPTSVVGWGSTGGISLKAWPTSNAVNYKLCNETAASISAGAVTLNVSAR